MATYIKGGYEMSKGKREHVNPVDEIMTPPVEETKVEVQEQPKTASGTVVDCIRLNIRKKPSVNSQPVGSVAVNTELKVNLNQSNDEWLKVCTKDGTEGFCMKKYVKIEP